MHVITVSKRGGWKISCDRHVIVIFSIAPSIENKYKETGRNEATVLRVYLQSKGKSGHRAVPTRPPHRKQDWELSV